MKRLLGQALFAGLGQLLARGALILAFLLFARSFDAATFARIGYFNVTLSAVLAIATMGIGTLATRLWSHGDWSGPDERQASALLFMAGGSALLCASLAFFWPLGIDSVIGRLALSLCVAAAVVGAVAAGALAGQQAYRRLALHAAIAAVATLILSLLSVSGERPAIAILAIAAGYAVKSLLDLAATHGALRARARTPSLPALRTAARSTFSLAATAIINAAGLWGLATLILQRLGDQPFAQYAVGMQWYAIGAFVAANLTRVMLPRQVQAFRHGGRSPLLVKAMAIAVAGCLGLAALAWLAAPIIMQAYSGSIEGLGGNVWLFMLASVSIAPANMIANQLIAEEREGCWLVASIMWGAALVAFGVLALPYGLLALLAALVAANVAMMLAALAMLGGGARSCPA